MLFAATYLSQKVHQRVIAMEIGVLKEEENRLKRDIISSLEAQFVGQYDKWKSRQELFNEVVLQYNTSFKRRLKPLSYDEFCRLFIRGSKAILDEYVRMENIVPNPADVESIKQLMDNKDDVDEFKRRYSLVLEAKHMRVRIAMTKVWDERVFRSIVNERYGSKYYDSILAIKKETLQRLN